MKKIILLFIAALFIAGCNYTPLVPINSPAPTVPPATRTPRPTATEAPRPTRIPQDTPTPTITPTAVPSGVFALLIYRPFVLEYDPATWTDKTCYACVNDAILLSSNYLQSQTMASCKISVQAPTEIDSNTAKETLTLDTLAYDILLWGEGANGLTSNWYGVQSQSFPDNYNVRGLPLIVVQARTAEWNDCKALAEAVLATLRVP